jgi:hypothetical protein
MTLREIVLLLIISLWALYSLFLGWQNLVINKPTPDIISIIMLKAVNIISHGGKSSKSDAPFAKSNYKLSGLIYFLVGFICLGIVIAKVGEAN